MSVELLAIGLLFAWSVFSGLVGLVQLRRTKTEIREEAQEMIESAGNTFLDAFGDVLADPTISKAFGIIGSQGGTAKGENMLVDQMATDMLDTPQFEAIKMGASSLLGFDIDAYIEKHGAVKTLKAANQLAASLGIDLMKLDLGSILGGATQGGEQSGGSAYLRR